MRKYILFILIGIAIGIILEYLLIELLLLRDELKKKNQNNKICCIKVKYDDVMSTGFDNVSLFDFHYSEKVKYITDTNLIQRFEKFLVNNSFGTISKVDDSMILKKDSIVSFGGYYIYNKKIENIIVGEIKMPFKRGDTIWETEYSDVRVDIEIIFCDKKSLHMFFEGGYYNMILGYFGPYYETNEDFVDLIEEMIDDPIAFRDFDKRRKWLEDRELLEKQDEVSEEKSIEEKK